MKKFAWLLALSTLFFHAPLMADEPMVPAADTVIPALDAAAAAADTAVPAPAEENTGVAATSATDVAKTSSWQNWVFAIGAIVAAAVGIIIVAFSQGSSAH